MLWTAATAAAEDLRGQLRALKRAGYGCDPEDVEIIRQALFVLHRLANRG
jgi:hypothetical protein